jgi:hypothetical protein
VTTEIGYFVNRAWVTESIAPGIVACSHHLGRWRLNKGEGSRWSTPRVRFPEVEGGTLLRQIERLGPFPSSDPDSSRIWWSDGGVHQNLTFPVHPDPVSGMHCWHQAVRVVRAEAGDRYGDIVVDTAKSHQVYQAWMARTRSAMEHSPDGTRRPYWLIRPVKPVREAYALPQAPSTEGASS